MAVTRSASTQPSNQSQGSSRTRSAKASAASLLPSTSTSTAELASKSVAEAVAGPSTPKSNSSQEIVGRKKRRRHRSGTEEEMELERDFGNEAGERLRVRSLPLHGYDQGVPFGQSPNAVSQGDTRGMQNGYETEIGNTNLDNSEQRESEMEGYDYEQYQHYGRHHEDGLVFGNEDSQVYQSQLNFMSTHTTPVTNTNITSNMDTHDSIYTHSQIHQRHLSATLSQTHRNESMSRSPTPSGSSYPSTSDANAILQSETGYFNPVMSSTSGHKRLLSPSLSQQPPAKRRRLKEMKLESLEGFGPIGPPAGSPHLADLGDGDEEQEVLTKETYRPRITIESLPTSVISHILSFLPQFNSAQTPHQMPSQPDPETLRTLLSLCLVGSRALLPPVLAALYHCPYLPTRANAHKLHVAFHANPKLRNLVKRLEIDLDGMCEKREETRGGRSSGNNVWLPWYLHQTLLFFSPILLSVSSLLSFSINLPSNASVYMTELNRVWGTWDTLLHFSKDLFPPDRTRSLDDPPNYPPREIAIPHANDDIYAIYSPSPSSSPSLWPVRSLMTLVLEWSNLEYLAWRGLVSEYAPTLANPPSVPTFPRWTDVTREETGKWLKEVVLVDVAIGDDDLRGLIGTLPLKRFVLWRSSLVSRIGLRDAILTRADGMSPKITRQYDPANPPAYSHRHKLQELILGPGWWGTITTNNKPSVSADPAASYPLDEVLAHLPDLKHLYFEGDLMSVDCLREAKNKWANAEGLDTLVIKGCIGGSGGSGIWTPEKIMGAITAWDTVKMRKAHPTGWTPKKSPKKSTRVGVDEEEDESEPIEESEEQEEQEQEEKEEWDFIPFRGKGMCRKLRLLLGGVSRVRNFVQGGSTDWSQVQMKRVRELAKPKNCELRVKYGEIVIWQDEPDLA